MNQRDFLLKTKSFLDGLEIPREHQSSIGHLSSTISFRVVLKDNSQEVDIEKSLVNLKMSLGSKPGSYLDTMIDEWFNKDLKMKWISTTIKEKWLAKILSGEKKIERKITNEFWKKRLLKFVPEDFEERVDISEIGLNLLCGTFCHKFKVNSVVHCRSSTSLKIDDEWTREWFEIHIGDEIT